MAQGLEAIRILGEVDTSELTMASHPYSAGGRAAGKQARKNTQEEVNESLYGPIEDDFTDEELLEIIYKYEASLGMHVDKNGVRADAHTWTKADVIFTTDRSRIINTHGSFRACGSHHLK